MRDHAQKKKKRKKEQAQTQSWVKFVNISDYFKVSLTSNSILKPQFFLPQKRIEYNFPWRIAHVPPMCSRIVIPFGPFAPMRGL